MGQAVIKCLQAANEAIVEQIANGTKINLVPVGSACRKHTTEEDCYIWVVSGLFGPGQLCSFHFNLGEVLDAEDPKYGEMELWWCAAYENGRIHTLSNEENSVLEEVYAWLELEGYFDGEDKQ